MRSLDRKLAQREKEREMLFRALPNCDRRTFLRLAGKLAAVAAAAGAAWPHSFQLVEFTGLADASEAASQVAFRLAYISDTHLFDKGMSHRFVKAALKAVEDVNALDPQPDFVLFGGDLAQLGQPGELALGRQILSEVKAPLRVMVGEHDWYFDMGEKWRELFGEPTYSWEHKGVHFVVLNSVVEKDFWTERAMTPMERMITVAGLDNPVQSRFEVGEEQRDWLFPAPMPSDDRPRQPIGGFIKLRVGECVVPRFNSEAVRILRDLALETLWDRLIDLLSLELDKQAGGTDPTARNRRLR